MSEDPLPWDRLGAPFSDTTQAGLQGSRLAVDPAQRERVLLQMQMSVYEPGQHDASFQILAGGSLEFDQQILPADRQNHSVIHGKCRGRRLRSV